MVPFQNGFVKQVRLSGKEKAAILLGELGFTTETLCRYFSDSELKKINKGFASLGEQYNVNLENSVLEETCAYGISRNLLVFLPVTFTLYLLVNKISLQFNRFKITRY